MKQLGKATILGACMLGCAGSATAEKTEITVMENAVFYDGYLTDRVVDADADDGILRHTNYLYARRLDNAEIARLGNDLKLHLSLGARCDNYDRMGDVRLVMAPKGAQTYDKDEVERIELARFITPFMNRNRLPRSINYEWEIPEAAYIMHDTDILNEYDLWMEVELFGIPYAAQQQIVGCSTRNDVFGVTLTLEADSDCSNYEAAAPKHELLPIYVSQCEIHGPVNLNNYNPAACDEVGVTSRTFTFSADKALSDAQLNLILTNHGANEDGEEYVRRLHYVYVDDELKLTYMPGGVSCEPYRRYNTQGNFIYGPTPLPPEEWEWNNWCPGQAVPIRRISLGALSEGEHTVRIYVPDAEFAGGEGDFRPSMYVQGVTEGSLDFSAVEEVADDSIEGAKFWRVGDAVCFSAPTRIHEIRLYEAEGRLLEGRYNPVGSLSLAGRNPGAYLIVLIDEAGHTAIYKTMK